MAGMMCRQAGFIALLLVSSCETRPPNPRHQPMNVIVEQPYFGERGVRQLPGVPAEDLLFWVRWEAESIEPNEFLPILDRSLRGDAIRGSRDVLDSILRPEAHLYGRPEAHHSFHVRPDCLLHRYDVGELALLVYEQQHYITVRVAAAALAREPVDAFVSRVMGRLLKFTPTWHFVPANAPGEGVRFSTATDPTMTLGYMSTALFGAVVPGGLYFTMFRHRSDDYSGRPTWEHLVVNDRLRQHWATVRGTVRP